MDPGEFIEATRDAAHVERHRMFRAEMDNAEQTQGDARNLMLLEWAKEWLLDEGRP